ncbi:MAG: hypothetical protein LBJ40_21355 [Delftia acidovorans]|jgi:hypothetical protein|nr:hypothetical protein [Delftia acidovorans]
MTQTLTQLTLAWLIATIEATRAGLAGNLAQTPVADWGAAPVREVRNHEQDLHTAMQVLGDMLHMRGAFAASGIPAAPHLEQVPVYVCGVDLSGGSLADLKKALADPSGHQWRTHIQPMPATVALPWRTGIPAWTDDRAVRVIAVTAHDDFGGVQIHDIRASDFHTDGDGDGADVARACTHWAYRDDIWPGAAAAAPASPAANTEGA